MIAAVDRSVALDDIETALDHIRLGRPVVVIDDHGRENEGDLIFAAEFATPELVAFTVRYTSGFLCVALEESEADRLQLPPMYAANEDRRGTAYAVSVDARDGVSTGISARDRSRTIRLLADPATQAADLSRPGHVVPLRARRGGVLNRPGHTEAAIDLATLAGCRPAGVLCEVVSQTRPTEMARPAELRKFADRHQLAMICIADLIAYRQRHEPAIRQSSAARLPLEQAEFSAVGFCKGSDTREHLALVLGDVSVGQEVLVRVQAECLAADAFGSVGCECRAELDAALTAIAREGRGVLLYLRSQPGHGHALSSALAVAGCAGFGAHPSGISSSTGLPTDAEDHQLSVQILHTLGIKSMRLLTTVHSAARSPLLEVRTGAALDGTGHRVRLVNSDRGNRQHATQLHSTDQTCGVAPGQQTVMSG